MSIDIPPSGNLLPPVSFAYDEVPEITGAAVAACPGSDPLSQATQSSWHQAQAVLRLFEQFWADPEALKGKSEESFATEKDLPGSPRLPGYRIVAELGRGGMGVVYKAYQEGLKRYVALKMIPFPELADPSRLARFRAEAVAVARLHHPNIIQIYEVGEYKGCPYFSLELVNGGNLAQKLAAGPPPCDDAASLLHRLSLAVDYAHQNGIVHRDLKPANILLAGDAAVSGEWSQDSRLISHQPKITDFGLAKWLEGGTTTGVVLGQTRTGDILGTAEYMAPEQASGRTKEVGPATDVYALGAMLYQMLTGRPPFRADSSAQTVRQVLEQEAIPPRWLHPKVPRDLETICLKCLEKEPKKRYASAAALAEDLRRFVAGEPIRARPTRTWEHVWKWAKRRPAIAGLLTLIVVVSLLGSGLVAWQWQRAEGALANAEKNLYFQGITLADRESYDGSLARVEQYLAECRPALRNWEWHHLKRRCHAELLTLAGHMESVADVVYSPSGSHLASASLDKTLKIWDAATGRALLTLRGHSDPVLCAAFSPDGLRLASGGRHRVVKVWDIVTGQEILSLKGHESEVTTVAFSPDGTQLASGSEDKTVRIWDAATGRQIHLLGGRIASVTSVAFSPDGRLLACATAERTGGEVMILDATKGIVAHTFRNENSGFMTLAFSPNGQRLAAGLLTRDPRLSEPGQIKIWDTTTHQEILHIPGHRGSVLALAFSADGRDLASAGRDATVRIWEAATGTEKLVLRTPSDVDRLSLSPDGRRVAVADINRTVQIFDCTSAHGCRTLRDHADAVNHVAFSRDGRYLATASADDTIMVWDQITGLSLPRLHHEGFWRGVMSVAFSPDDRYLASASACATLKIWVMATGNELRELQHPDVFSVVFSPDGRRLASGSRDGSVRVWDTATWQEVFSVAKQVGEIRSLAFSPDGKRLASACGDRLSAETVGRLAHAIGDCTIKVWDAGSGQELLTFRHHAQAVNSVAFSPDGVRIASASDDTTVKVWDAQSGRELVTCRGHEKKVSSVAFSPDGLRLASASDDFKVKLWEATTGREILTLPGHTGATTSVAFSPDGRRLVSGSWDGTAKIWDATPVEE